MPIQRILTTLSPRAGYPERQVNKEQSLNSNYRILRVACFAVGIALVLAHSGILLAETVQVPLTEAAKADFELAKLDPDLPTLFVASDSTAAKSYIDNQVGWAEPLPQFFDTSKLNVINLARSGRSSRTYQTEGWWAQLLAHAKPGDIVLIQFAHNDAGAIDAFNARGSIPGLGKETKVVLNAVTKRYEVVHTFGSNIRQMVAQAKERELQPVLVSPTIRNSWKNGRLDRDPDNHAAWLESIARESEIPFVDLSNAAADALELIGQTDVREFYRGKTHLSQKGADLHARHVSIGLLEIEPLLLDRFLSAEGETLHDSTQ